MYPPARFDMFPPPAGQYDLGGAGWQCGDVPQQPPEYTGMDAQAVEAWLPARVPGEVRLDLAAAGRIPDPHMGDNLAAGQWAEARDWWYRRPLLAPLGSGQRAFVTFAGIDYRSAVFANARALGRYEGMFASQTYELTEMLATDRPLELGVRIWGSASLPHVPRGSFAHAVRALGRLLRLSELPYPDRLATWKCPMSYGWDFAPRLLGMGLWDDVTLKICGPAALMSLWATPIWPAEGTSMPAELTLRVLIEVDSLRPASGRLELTLAGENFSAKPQLHQTHLELSAGRQPYEVRLSLSDPAFWQPWDRGFPHLYRLTALLHLDGAETPSDALDTTFGLRRLRLRPARGWRPGEADWIWEINGRREFVRGLNWVPADAQPGRLLPADYQELVGLARAGGANLLRVWGGGLRERRAFYEACDRAGVLVWQEFPLACLFLDRLPDDAGYLDLVRRESGAIVRTLRGHPSLALWCGGNELSPRRQRHVVNQLSEAVDRFDGTRPFLPASPCAGDRHNWDVWHGQAPAHTYRAEAAAFVSELGLQAAPNVESLRQFLAPADLWPAGAGWVRRHAQLSKLHRYADLYPWDDLAGFVAASQRAQARSLQIAIEHLRRRKGACGGLALWQFNEPWPAISWALLDYYRQPKLALRLLPQWYSPLLVSLDYPLRPYAQGDRLTGSIWVVNDGLEPLPACEVRLLHAGALLWSAEAQIGPDEAQPVGAVDVALGDPAQLLCLELWQAGQRIAHNDYDLAGFDARPGISRWRRLRRRVADGLLR